MTSSMELESTNQICQSESSITSSDSSISIEQKYDYCYDFPLAITVDEQQDVIVGLTNGLIRQYDIQNQQYENFQFSMNRQIWSLENINVNDQAYYIASATDDGKVRIYDKSNRKLAKMFQQQSFPYSLCHTKESSLLMIGYSTGKIAVWNLLTDVIQTFIDAHLFLTKSILSNDYLKRIVSAGFDSVINNIDLGTQKIINKLKGHGSSQIYQLAMVNPQNNLIASASDDASIKIWHNGSNKCVQNLAEHEGPVRAVCSLDDNKIISGGSNGWIKLWDIRKGCIDTFKNIHDNAIYCLKYHKKYNKILSGARDCFLKIWV